MFVTFTWRNCEICKYFDRNTNNKNQPSEIFLVHTSYRQMERREKTHFQPTRMQKMSTSDTVTEKTFP